MANYLAIAVSDLTICCTKEEADILIGVHAGMTDEAQWRYFACTEAEITQKHQWGPGQEELIHALTDAT